jgi:hypothetical protein
MKDRQKSISIWLAKRTTRAWIHVGIMLIAAGVLLGSMPSWHLFRLTPRTADGLWHYRAGQVITGSVFYLAYLGIILRVFLVGRGRGSMTRVLLWIPPLLAAGILAAIIIAVLLSVGKEAWDWGGAGKVEWIDVTAGLDGALSMLPAVALIMVITPFFIPLDILMQIPKLMLSDMRTGIKGIDKYIRAQRSHSGMDRPADILVVEDDIHCATAIMNFSGNVGLKCHHVSTISEADGYLRDHLDTIRVVTLDIFVRVDSRGNNKTGSEWLMELGVEFPPGHRSFSIVVISGHPRMLGEAGTVADLILKKPWEPSRLAQFLREKDILKNT